MEKQKVPIERNVLKHVYAYMKVARYEFEDDEDYSIVRVPLFTKEELSEVKRALRRKRI